MTDSILVADADGLRSITLNRPDRLNAFTTEMLNTFNAALTDAAADDSVRTVLITGSGRGFCAGQDLNDRSVAPGGAAPDLGESLENRYNPAVRTIRTMAKPVVIAVNGVAAGAGANLALAGDLVFAAKSAKFIQSFARIGLIPDSGGTYFLPRRVGSARAMGLALLGDAIGAEQAADWGLIWRAVDDEQLLETAGELARQLAAGPTAGFAKTKQALNASGGNSLDAQLDLERDLQQAAGHSNDYTEGVAAFLEKRPPVFGGS
ncbi:MAG: 2-(1,2-epoxy-1,2-dihydrophenyl)acetyl-CoA isomerase [bacterium]|nr:2-(1,2-epoxy-1,2-dihydrophenyl)acetyl-CoA isomerase [bacterium]MCP4964482.1 2-(1,2-epoxy-1,2-dihydrophenyl)acetyl-CoA isomerase [bacterium]